MEMPTIPSKVDTVLFLSSEEIMCLHLPELPGCPCTWFNNLALQIGSLHGHPAFYQTASMADRQPSMSLLTLSCASRSTCDCASSKAKLVGTVTVGLSPSAASINVLKSRRIYSCSRSMGTDRRFPASEIPEARLHTIVQPFLPTNRRTYQTETQLTLTSF